MLPRVNGVLITDAVRWSLL